MPIGNEKDPQRKALKKAMLNAAREVPSVVKQAATYGIGRNSCVVFNEDENGFISGLMNFEFGNLRSPISAVQNANFFAGYNKRSHFAVWDRKQEPLHQPDLLYSGPVLNALGQPIITHGGAA